MTDAHPLPAEDDPDRAAPGQRHRAGRPRGLPASRGSPRRNPDGSCEIIDLGSHGGTYVNGERITHKMLTERDIVDLGHATFGLSSGELRQYADESPGGLPAMTNAHEVVAAYWASAEARDWKAFGALLADDVIYRGPEMGSRCAAGARYPVQRGGLHLRLAPHRAANRRRRPARSQLDRVYRAGRHPARPVLLRPPRRRQDRPDHRLLARAIRTSSQPRSSGRTLLSEGRKGTTLSDKTARTEFGLTQDEK